MTIIRWMRRTTTGRCRIWVKRRHPRNCLRKSGSALKADIDRLVTHVREGPCVDGSGLARRIFTSQAWSVLPCVRPVGAVHMTAGHNALRGIGSSSESWEP
jgi:hypothetical protein